jgi:hypothetical protein
MPGDKVVSLSKESLVKIYKEDIQTRKRPCSRELLWGQSLGSLILWLICIQEASGGLTDTFRSIRGRYEMSLSRFFHTKSLAVESRDVDAE